jgi:hypothetical protein
MDSIMRIISRSADALLGRGEWAVTVPPMDGALKPNVGLDRLSTLAAVSRPDNLIDANGRLLFSSDKSVLHWCHREKQIRPVTEFPYEVSAMAALLDGGWAAALMNGELRVFDRLGNERSYRSVGEYTGYCPTAILALDESTLIVSEGSTQHRPDQWKRDLITKGQSGSVWRLNLARNAAIRMSSGVRFPYGLASLPDGRILVSESWRHRLLALSLDKRESHVSVDGLPGYPSRIAPAGDGGYWLCVFAPRSQLIEFVLREKHYRSRMLDDIPEQYWVAPTLSSGHDFKEPLQGGAIKSMGILKPWAPTRSYGLLVKLDADLEPTFSLHSRSDGHRHGIMSALEFDGHIFTCSKGGDEILVGAIEGIEDFI